MATATKGQEYTGHNYDPTGINQIYTTIAQDIHVKLSN
jgi:hypothetical protein